MIFLDSWLWLEVLFDDEDAVAAKDVIERADDPDVGGLIAPTVTAEVAYRVCVVEDEETAREATGTLHDFEHVESLPINDRLAEYAAELRWKYYDPGTRELSYADAIHLATASAHDECDVLYTGDPDFEGVDEVDTVVL